MIVVMIGSFNFDELAQSVGTLLDAAGVLVIVGGIIISTSVAIVNAFTDGGVHSVYRSYRYNLARSILIGLEFLVAGDIIRTVAGELSLDSVLLLGVIILIRSLLGIQFEMEIEGKWPWKRGKTSAL